MKKHLSNHPKFKKTDCVRCGEEIEGVKSFILGWGPFCSVCFKKPAFPYKKPCKLREKVHRYVNSGTKLRDSVNLYIRRQM